MIDPIGAPAGILALVTFVFNVTVTLRQAISNIQNFPSEMIALGVELDDVQKVLSFLRKAASHNADDLVQLEPLLSHCGQACQDFLELISKYSTETKGKREVFISWVKSQVAKNDIKRIIGVLNRVKATTTIALGTINLHRFAVTSAAIDEYQRIVTDAIAEMQQSLRQINSQLESFSKQHPHVSDQDIEEWKQLQANKKQCENDLQAFSEVLALLQKVELEKLDTILNNPDTNQALMATLERPTKERLSITDIRDFMERVPQAILDLKLHLCSIEEKMRPFPKVELETRQTLQDDKQADEHHLNILRQCNDKADQKRLNVFKDVRAAERARQVIISNVGELFNCEGVSAGPGATQVFGQYSDESIQRIFSGENAMPPSNGKLYQNDTLQNREWIAWHFVAMFASSGFVAWIVNRGLTYSQ